jgi:hypothetical protein
MPDPSVRFSHLIESSTSGFIYGVCITFHMQWRPALSKAGVTQRAEP